MLKDIFKLSAMTLLVSAGLTGCGAEPQDWVDAFTNAGEQLNLNNTAPVIVLVGPSTVEVPLNGTYQEPGFVALDEEDGDLTDHVLYNTDSVDTSTPGKYTIIYRVKDSGNLSAALTVRVVIVTAEEQSVVQPEPPVVSPEPTPLIANDNHYTVEAGQVFHATGTQGVGNNDIFDATNTAFSVVSYPQNGELMMSIDGMFTYQPDFGFSGTDSFVYQIANNVGVSTATASITVVKETETSKGFTAFTPSSDSRVIFVSNSVGSDSNDCLSEATPCKSIAAGINKMRDGHPDHLYLKRGDTWRDQVLHHLRSGKSTGEPAVIAYYGQSGSRPRLEVSGVSHIHRDRIAYVHIIGLEISAYQLDPSHPQFSGTQGGNIVMLGAKENILFEDNRFNYVEVIGQDWQGGNPKNLTFRRNIWTGYYSNQTSFNRNSRPSNLYMNGVDGLVIEENVFDYGGWNPVVEGAGANMFNHNIYLQHNNNGERIVLRNNIITRASSHGAQLRAGGLAEDNFFGRNALGLLIGYSVEPLKTGVKAHAFYNVASEGHSMVKGKDACTGSGLCTPAVWGIEFDVNGDADWQAKGNIAARLAPNDLQWETTYNRLVRRGLPGLDHSAAQSSQNIAWKWDSDDQGSDASYPNPGRTLGDYNAKLGGENSFDAFMEVVKNRPLQTWDVRYTASAINDFIREGFNLTK